MRHCKTVLAGCLVLLLPLGVGCSKKSLTLDLGKGVTMKFVLIPAGKFRMGSAVSAEELAKQYETKAEYYKDEHPQHQVRITKPFYMGVTAVTQAQWKAVMNTQPWEGKTHVKQGNDYPVTYVSWEDATAFCDALSRRAGKSVRLPTEAQWEYACRAGTTTKYCFGDDDTKLGDYAWYYKNARHVGEEYAHRVAQKKPNAWGLYDMHGNVWEWCADWYGASYYAGSPGVDPQGPSGGKYRVLRGGTWLSDVRNCRTAIRFWYAPDGRARCVYGFRVAVLSAGVD